MSNEVTTTEQTEPQLNVINYNPVFPTLMAQVLLDLPVEDMNEDILKLAVDTKNYSGGYTTFFNQQSIEHVRGVQQLKEAVYGVVCSYGRELKYEMNYDKCAINIWANVMRRGGYHIPHNHPRTIVSGTFYSRVEDDMSPICFYNPTTIYRGNEPVVRPQDFTAFTSDTLTIKPKVNHMLIWPSWMVHEVTQMEVSGPRISFSFNVDFLPPGA